MNLSENVFAVHIKIKLIIQSAKSQINLTDSTMLNVFQSSFLQFYVI